MQASAEVASPGNGVSHRFDIRLMMVADDRMRGPVNSTQGATEEGFRAGATPFLPWQNIDDLPLLIHCTIEVALLSAAEAEHFLAVPSPAHSSSVVREGRGELRAEGLDPVEHRAC